jgi:hypothetical protein
MRRIDLDIQGLGVILYSPYAVTHIAEGADYFTQHFREPADVARHVKECRLTAFCTGSPGRFRLAFVVGTPDEAQVQAAAFKLRLGLEVRSGTVCVRDLYDLMEWTAECPEPQTLKVADGFYRLTVCSSPPPTGILGDDQAIMIWMEAAPEKPILRWEGVPSLC